MLDSDILYSIFSEVADCPAHDVQALKNISLGSRWLRELTLPLLFAEVRWPHEDKHSQEQGLEFFPESLLRYFKQVFAVNRTITTLIFYVQEAVAALARPLA